MADDNIGSTQAIPQDVRDMAENSVAQARRAVEQYLQVAHRTMEATDRSAQAMQAGARNMSSKAIEYAEANVRGAFDFAERLVRARDAQEVMSLQQEFLRQQVDQMNEQMRALGSLGAGTVRDASGSGS